MLMGVCLRRFCSDMNIAWHVFVISWAMCDFCLICDVCG